MVWEQPLMFLYSQLDECHDIAPRGACPAIAWPMSILHLLLASEDRHGLGAAHRPYMVSPVTSICSSIHLCVSSQVVTRECWSSKSTMQAVTTRGRRRSWGPTSLPHCPPHIPFSAMPRCQQMSKEGCSTKA